MPIGWLMVCLGVSDARLCMGIFHRIRGKEHLQVFVMAALLFWLLLMLLPVDWIYRTLIWWGYDSFKLVIHLNDILIWHVASVINYCSLFSSNKFFWFYVSLVFLEASPLFTTVVVVVQYVDQCVVLGRKCWNKKFLCAVFVMYPLFLFVHWSI